MKKKFLTLIVVLSIIFSTSISSLAADISKPIEPIDSSPYEFAISSNCNITIKNTLASIESTTISCPGSFVDAYLYIYEINGDDLIFIDSWESHASRRATFVKEFTVQTGKTYHAILDVTITCNGTEETFTITDTKTAK